jgi:hypothetical protein
MKELIKYLMAVTFGAALYMLASPFFAPEPIDVIAGIEQRVEEVIEKELRTYDETKERVGAIREQEVQAVSQLTSNDVVDGLISELELFRSGNPVSTEGVDNPGNRVLFYRERRTRHSVSSADVSPRAGSIKPSL